MNTTEKTIDIHAMPTRETYDALQHAYDHFNWTLFENELANCLITLQRKGRTYGYFCRKRFVRDDGALCDEIALNPVHFNSRSVEESLSTLVHEMVHLWQFHFGETGRGRYHNRQWAEKMKSVGLHPSHTGKLGGRELGDQVSHYIIEGSPFASSAENLIASGFKLEWRDDTPSEIEAGLSALLAAGSASLSMPIAEPGSKAGKRIKYTCASCGLNAWAKHEAYIICGEDRLPLRAN